MPKETKTGAKTRARSSRAKTTTPTTAFASAVEQE